MRTETSLQCCTKSSMKMDSERIDGSTFRFHSCKEHINLGKYKGKASLFATNHKYSACKELAASQKREFSSEPRFSK